MTFISQTKEALKQIVKHILFASVPMCFGSMILSAIFIVLAFWLLSYGAIAENQAISLIEFSFISTTVGFFKGIQCVNTGGFRSWNSY